MHMLGDVIRSDVVNMAAECHVMREERKKKVSRLKNYVILRQLTNIEGRGDPALANSQQKIRFPVSMLYIKVKAADFFPRANNSRLNMKI